MKTTERPHSFELRSEKRYSRNDVEAFETVPGPSRLNIDIWACVLMSAQDPSSLVTVQNDAFLSAMSLILCEMQTLSKRTESIANDVATLTEKIENVSHQNENRWKESIATMNENIVVDKQKLPIPSLTLFDTVHPFNVQTKDCNLTPTTREELPREEPNGAESMAGGPENAESIAEEPLSNALEAASISMSLEESVQPPTLAIESSNEFNELVCRVERLEEALSSTDSALKLQHDRFSAHVNAVEALGRITTQAQYTFEAHGQRLEEQEKTIQTLLLGLEERISAASEQEQELEKVHASILRVQKSFKPASAPQEQLLHTFQTDVTTQFQALKDDQNAHKEALSREIRSVHTHMSTEIEIERHQTATHFAELHSKIEETSLLAMESIASFERKAEDAKAATASAHTTLHTYIVRFLTQLYADLSVLSKALRKSIAHKRSHISKDAIDDTIRFLQNAMHHFDRQNRSIPSTLTLVSKARAFVQELDMLQTKLQQSKFTRADLYSQFAWPLTLTIASHIRIFESGANASETELYCRCQSVVIQMNSTLFALCFQLHQWTLEDTLNSFQKAHDALCKRIAPLYVQSNRLDITEESLHRIQSRIDAISDVQVTCANDTQMKAALQDVVVNAQHVRDQLTALFLDRLDPLTQKNEHLENEIHSIASTLSLKSDTKELCWMKETLEQRIEILEHSLPLDTKFTDIQRSLRSKIGKSELHAILASQSQSQCPPSATQNSDTHPIASLKCISCNSTPSMQSLQLYISHQIQSQLKSTLKRSFQTSTVKSMELHKRILLHRSVE